MATGSIKQGPNIDEVLERFDGARPAGTGWIALCPAHDDSNPSLAINEGDDGRILLKCYAGCETEAVLDAAGLEWGDLFGNAGGGAGAACRRQPEPLSEEESDFRDRAYRSLLEQMTLSDDHRKHLRDRGLNDESIDANGYRSLDQLSAYLDPKPDQDFPDERLRTLPGYRLRKVQRWGDVGYFTAAYFEAGPGILIPVRDARGRFVSGQVRLFDPTGPKYRWLSGSRAIPHVPRGVTAPCPVVRVTEGPLKADVTTCLCPEVPTVGIGGVSSWRSALPLIEGLSADEVRLAFDADWQSNPAVAGALMGFADELDRRGYVVSVETWDSQQGKGIDDLLKAGGRPVAVPLGEARKAATCAAITQPAGRNGVSGADGKPESRLPSWPDPVPISHLAETAGSELTWIWQDYLPDRSIVLLTALWKSGKTTLLGHLLSAMSAGKTEFCGRPLRKCKVLLLTQEQDAIWNQRREQFALSDDVVFFQRGMNDSPRPFVTRPTSKQWKVFIGHLADVVRKDQLELVVIDPLADFWPVEDENIAPQVTDALEPLRQLHDAGCSVLLLHHPRKSGGEGGTAHRGSGQLAAFVDVMMELRTTGNAGSKRRVLRAIGEAHSPDNLTIELTDHGYVVVGSAEAQAQVEQSVASELADVVNILPTDGTAKSARELLSAWVGKEGKSGDWAARKLLARLNQAADLGLVVRSGTGKKNDPSRFQRT